MSKRPKQLEGSWLKIRRAKEHINRLNRSIARFFASHPYFLNWERLPDDYADPPNHIFRIGSQEVPTPPPQWGVRIGEIVTNLRSSLDYIAWELSLRPGGKPITHGRDISFPILTNPDGGGFHRATRFMATDAADEIRKFQPDPDIRANWPDVGLLWLLNELVGVEKHRVLTQTFTQTHVRLGPGFDSMPIGGLNNPQNPVRLIVTHKAAAQLGDEFQPDFTPDVAINVDIGTLGIREIDGLPALIDLSVFALGDIHDFIRNTVFPSFLRYFP